MQDRNQLKEELKRLRVIGMTINQVLNRGLADILFEDETVKHFVSANLSKEYGFLILSDKRLFFIPYSKQRSIIYFNRVHISSASYSGNWLMGQIDLRTSDGVYQFTNVPNMDDSMAFTEALNQIGRDQKSVNEAANTELTSNSLPAPSEEVEQIVNEGIFALRNGEKDKAQNLLMEAIRLNRNHEKAWLWLSGVVSSDNEQRECLEMVLSINPQNQAAIKGLSLLPPIPPEISTHPNNVQVITEMPVSPVSNAVRTEYCRHCGKSILADSKFCSHCGQTLSPVILVQPVISTQESTTSAPTPIARRSTSEEYTIIESTTRITKKGPSDWIGAKKITVTNKRVIWKSGVLDKTEVSILISKVQDVTIKYNLVGRAMGYGTLHIIASGAAEIIAEDITDAESVKSAILKQTS